MSRENVEIVQSYYELFGRWLEAYRENPGPLEESAFVDELFERLDPDVEWDWVVNDEVFRGRIGLIRAVADWLESFDAWHAELGETREAGSDHVLGVLHVDATGKGSGLPIKQDIYSVYTIRDGKIARFADYLDRTEALKAAGLTE